MGQHRMDDKRKFRRAVTATALRLFDSQDKLICSAVVKNISKEGIFVLLFDLRKCGLFEPTKEVRFQLLLPSGTVPGIAQVRWISPKESQMGLMFMKLDQESDRKNIESFVSSLLIQDS